jgi:hypothetical protein
LRPPRESESSESADEAVSSEPSLFSTSFVADFAALFFARLGATESTGAAWKIGTGIAAAFLRVLGVVSLSVASLLFVTASVTSGEVSLLLLFLTARLRGDFGSIAMAPNPLARTF